MILNQNTKTDILHFQWKNETLFLYTDLNPGAL